MYSKYFQILVMQSKEKVQFYNSITKDSFCKSFSHIFNQVPHLKNMQYVICSTKYEIFAISQGSDPEPLENIFIYPNFAPSNIIIE